jgi:hypothetical protein
MSIRNRQELSTIKKNDRCTKFSTNFGKERFIHVSVASRVAGCEYSSIAEEKHRDDICSFLDGGLDCVESFAEVDVFCLGVHQVHLCNTTRNDSTIITTIQNLSDIRSLRR